MRDLRTVVVEVRITSASGGEVDGVELADFQVGAIYDLDRTLATYLVVLGMAEVVIPNEPAQVAADNTWVDDRVWMGPKSDLAVAADSGVPRKRR